MFRFKKKKKKKKEKKKRKETLSQTAKMLFDLFNIFSSDFCTGAAGVAINVHIVYRHPMGVGAGLGWVDDKIT